MMGGTEEPVKNLKLGVLICGALGVVGLLMSGIGMLIEVDKANTIIMLVAFALPVVLSAMAVARPPFLAWQSGVSLAGFALAAWKLRLWETIKVIGDVPTGMKLMLIGAALGVILSVIAVLKPEDRS